MTDGRGEFTLSAPAGPVSLSVRAIGYKRRAVAVGPDQTRIAIAVEPDIFNLEAVVVTGQATAVEQKNLPQAVSAKTSPVAANDYWEKGCVRPFLSRRVFDAILIDRK